MAPGNVRHLLTVHASVLERHVRCSELGPGRLDQRLHVGVLADARKSSDPNP
jgi:hypothetical protein